MTLPDEDLAHVWANIAPWKKLRGKRIFLTGASGFVGNWLVQSLAWANRHFSLAAHLIALPRDVFPPGNFDYGIHAANATDFRADIELTSRTLHFSVDRGVERILFTSSGSIYGKLPAGETNVSEDYLGAPYSNDPESGYAQAKRVGEFLFAECAQRFGLCAVIARLFAFAGPGVPLNANFAVGNFVRDVIAGGPIIVNGDGSAQRSYLYAADLAIWLWTILLEGDSDNAYNVGSPNAISIGALARAVALNTVPDTPIVTRGREVPGAGGYYVPSVERASKELHLRAIIPLDEAIRRMYAWNLQSKDRESGSAPPTTP